MGLLCWLGLSIGSTTGQTAHNLHSWWTYSGNHKLAEKTSLHTLYSFRRHDFVEQWQQSLLRLGLNYRIADNAVLMPGYDWVVTFPYGDQAIPRRTTEHRATMQAVVKNKVRQVGLSHRYRFEQRWIESGENHLSRQRLRYRLGLNIPLHRDEESGRAEWFLATFNEVFINLGNEVGNHFFDQNWIYLGLGYAWDSSASIKLGYMNQHLVKTDLVRRENNHTLMFSLSKNFDFSKKEK